MTRADASPCVRTCSRKCKANASARWTPDRRRRVPLGRPCTHPRPAAECLHESARSPALAWNQKPHRQIYVNSATARSKSENSLRPPECDPRSSRACDSTSVSTTGAFSRFASNTLVASLAPAGSPTTRSNYSDEATRGPTWQALHPTNHTQKPSLSPLSGHVPHVIRVRELHQLPADGVGMRCLATEPTHSALWPRLEKRPGARCGPSTYVQRQIPPTRQDCARPLLKRQY